MNAVVVSPHLDDAVFGCGDWLAAHPGTVVVTVFAGTPRDAAQCTGWDAQCGFATAREAMAARRDEDARALRVVGARPVWLDFRDGQYGEPDTAAAIADALAGLPEARAADRWLLPMGLFHADHALAHAAALRAAAAGPPVEVWLYEEALYRAMPGLVQRRLAALAAAGVEASPVLEAQPPAPDDRKARAVAAYASQTGAFGPGGLDDARRPERFWRLDGVGRSGGGDGETAHRWPTAAPASPC